LLSPTHAPALAVAAIAHAEILANEPFDTANGLVARALERLVLVVRGIDPASVLVPEAGHLALREEYLSTLRAYRTPGPAGCRAWLLHCAAAIGHAVTASPLA
jgi:Fic family protein